MSTSHGCKSTNPDARYARYVWNIYPYKHSLSQPHVRVLYIMHGAFCWWFGSYIKLLKWLVQPLFARYISCSIRYLLSICSCWTIAPAILRVYPIFRKPVGPFNQGSGWILIWIVLHRIDDFILVFLHDFGNLHIFSYGVCLMIIFHLVLSCNWPLPKT